MSLLRTLLVNDYTACHSAEEKVALIAKCIRTREDFQMQLAKTDSQGHNVIHYMAHEGNLEALKSVFKSIAVKDTLRLLALQSTSEGANMGDTPLFLAAQAGHKKVVQLLLSNGANPFLMTRYLRMSALHIACSRGHLETAMVLCEYPSCIYGSPSQEGKESSRLPAMSTFVSAGRTLRVVKGFQHVERINGSIPMEALRNSRLTWQMMPLELNQQTSNGRTPLHLAAIHSQLDIARLLVSFDVLLDVQDKWGNTPLDIARARKDQAMVDLLSAQMESRGLLSTNKKAGRRVISQGTRAPLKSQMTTVDVRTNIPVRRRMSAAKQPREQRMYLHERKESWTQGETVIEHDSGDGKLDAIRVNLDKVRPPEQWVANADPFLTANELEDPTGGGNVELVPAFKQAVLAAHPSSVFTKESEE